MELYDLKKRVKAEKWINIEENDGNLQLVNYSASQNSALQSTIIISLIVSILFVITFLILLGPGIKYMMEKLVSTSG